MESSDDVMDGKSTPPDAKLSVLLIGSTGNGKSTLGNFLLDPSGKLERKPFKTAISNLPETQDVRSVTTTRTDIPNYNEVKLTVIDTPGLNEGAAKDLEHMASLIRELQKIGEITACIFVVKFNSKIDIQYKSTIKYYAKLLPSLFERNAFVVMTDYANDERSVALRKKQGVDEREIQTNVVKTIVDHMGASYDDPITFMLDCISLSEFELKANAAIGSSIVEYILSLQPVMMESLTVAKTDLLLAVDRAKITEYEGAITGYKERLQEVNANATEALDCVHKKEKEVAELQAKIDLITVELKEKDTNELVTTATWSVDQEWKFLQAQQRGYELKSLWPICNIKRWTNGKCKLEDKIKTENTLQGIIIGEFMRGLYASIALETKKRLKYEKEIRELKVNLKTTSDESAKKQEELRGYSVQYERFRNEIQLFENFIENKRQLIIKLSNEKMSIDEAYQRLQQILDDLN